MTSIALSLWERAARVKRARVRVTRFEPCYPHPLADARALSQGERAGFSPRLRAYFVNVTEICAEFETTVDWPRESVCTKVPPAGRTEVTVHSRTLQVRPTSFS